MHVNVVYRIVSNTVISPFMDSARESLVANVPLADRVATAVAQAGLELVEVRPGDVLPRPGILLFDDTFVARDTLKTLAATPETSSVRVIGIADSVFVRTTAVLQGCPIAEVQDRQLHLYDVFVVTAEYALPALDDRDQLAAAIRNGAEPTELDIAEKVVELPVPEVYFGKSTLEVSLTGRPIVRLRHWLHLLWANQMALGLRWSEMSPLTFALRGLWAILRAASLNKYQILAKFNDIGRNCDIHPTAIVEGSVLGDDCHIGPLARVRFSHLGNGVIMQPNAQAEFAVVGDRAVISQNSAVNFSVLYPGSGASLPLAQVSILGRGAVVMSGSFLLDTNFGKPVRVKLDGQLVDSEQPFIGGAVGHDARIGNGIWVAPGREIPNGVVIIRSPHNTVSRLDDDLPTDVPLVIDQGRLIPW